MLAWGTWGWWRANRRRHEEWHDVVDGVADFNERRFIHQILYEDWRLQNFTPESEAARLRILRGRHARRTRQLYRRATQRQKEWQAKKQKRQKIGP